MSDMQIKLPLSEQSELAAVWSQMSAEEHAQIARLYCRLLLKAAKVEPPGSTPPKEQST